MALDTYESAIEGAKPVYLYLFTLGDRAWRYASSASDVVTQDGYVWNASPISHSGVSQTGEATTDALTIETTTDLAPAQVYIINPPTAPMNVVIFQKDVADGEVVAIYVGDISQVNQPEPGKAVVTCETLSVSMRREGLRLGWQRSCPYALYDPVNCKVNKEAHMQQVTVVSIDTFVVTVTGSLTPGEYVGGFFEWTHAVKGKEFLTVEAQSGNDLTVFGTTADLYPGIVLKLYKGCARTPTVCDEVFNNLNNYGGVPAMPGKSPFDGDPVF